MNVDIISPRMLEAGMLALKRVSAENWNIDPLSDEDAADLVSAIYEAMHAKHIESLGEDHFRAAAEGYSRLVENAKAPDIESLGGGESIGQRVIGEAEQHRAWLREQGSANKLPCGTPEGEG